MLCSTFVTFSSFMILVRDEKYELLLVSFFEHYLTLSLCVTSASYSDSSSFCNISLSYNVSLLTIVVPFSFESSLCSILGLVRLFYDNKLYAPLPFYLSNLNCYSSNSMTRWLYRYTLTEISRFCCYPIWTQNLPTCIFLPGLWLPSLQELASLQPFTLPIGRHELVALKRHKNHYFGCWQADPECVHTIV